MQYFERALTVSRLRIPCDLRPFLPRILWMYQMGLVLFWIFDRSANQVRTMALMDKSLAIVVRLIQLSAFPLLRPVRKSIVQLLGAMSERGRYGGTTKSRSLAVRDGRFDDKYCIMVWHLTLDFRFVVTKGGLRESIRTPFFRIRSEFWARCILVKKE